MEIPEDCDSIYCGECRTRVAFIEDASVQVWPSGIFDRLFNVENQNIHQSEFETTLADSCCVQCGTLLGWKFIAVTQPDMDVMVGTFLMRLCGTRVALVKDYVEIDEELTFVLQGIFTDMFNVEVPENDESYHQVLDGNTVVDTLCVNCRDRLGWKFIAVAQGSPYEAGQFLMMLDKLNYTNGQLLDPYDLAGGANEQNVDQAGDANNEENVDQAGGLNNEENADNQDGGANNADNQDGGANNADNQDGGANNADNQDGGGDQLIVSNGHSDRNPNI